MFEQIGDCLGGVVDKLNTHLEQVPVINAFYPFDQSLQFYDLSRPGEGQGDFHVRFHWEKNVGQDPASSDGDVFGEGQDRIHLIRFDVVLAFDDDFVFLIKTLVSPSVSLKRCLVL